VRFLVDAQLPPALARWLTGAGHDACHVEDTGLRDAEDSSIWHHAIETGAVLITKDEDLADRARPGRSSPVVVWLRIGNVSNHALRQWPCPGYPRSSTGSDRASACWKSAEPRSAAGKVRVCTGENRRALQDGHRWGERCDVPA